MSKLIPSNFLSGYRHSFAVALSAIVFVLASSPWSAALAAGPVPTVTCGDYFHGSENGFGFDINFDRSVSVFFPEEGSSLEDPEDGFSVGDIEFSHPPGLITLSMMGVDLGPTPGYEFGVSTALVRDSIPRLPLTGDELAVTVRVPAGVTVDRQTGEANTASNTLHRSLYRRVSVGDASALEGTDSNIEFKVTLGYRDDCDTVTVDWETAPGTATAGDDYTAASGTLTFGPGETTKTVSIAVLDDTQAENDETLTLRLSNASGATIADDEATGTVTDDDGNTLRVSIAAGSKSGTRSITPVSNSVTEGAAAVFTLTRTGSLADALTVDVSVTETSAMLKGSPAATVTFDANSAIAELSVETEDDEVAESASDITAALLTGGHYATDTNRASATVTVQDDDAAPSITVTGQISVNENTTAVATLTATDDDTPVADLGWSIVGGADAAAFSLSAKGVLSFAAAKDFEAPDDADQDGDYEVTVRVTDGANPAVDATLTVQLTDVDEGAPRLSGARVDGDTLTLTFDKALDGSSVPASNSFYVAVEAVHGDVVSVTSRSDSVVSVSGSTVTLTLVSAVVAGERVFVSYLTPTGANANPLKDADNNAVAAFYRQWVPNETPAHVNTPATGKPAISGAASVGTTLSASASGIADTDGLSNATFAWQWIANDGTSDADIAAATAETYTLTSTEAGKTIKVRITFTDDGGTEETLVSAATATVEAAVPPPSAWQPVTDVGITIIPLDLRDDTTFNAFSDESKAYFAKFNSLSVSSLDRTGVNAGERVNLLVRELSYAAPPIGSVRFELTGAQTVSRTDNTVPYTLFGDIVGQALPAGTYQVSVTPYPEADLAGTAGTPHTATFTLVADTTSPSVVLSCGEEQDSPDLMEIVEEISEPTIGLGRIYTFNNNSRFQGAISFGTESQHRQRRHVILVPDPTGGETTVVVLAGAIVDEAGNLNTASNLLHIARNRKISISDASVQEDTDETIDFEVTLDARNDCETVTMDWQTADGTATAGEDYAAARGTLTFGPGETVKTVRVAVIKDANAESDETFTLRLSNAPEITIEDAEATGTIRGDGTLASNAAPTGLPTVSGTPQVGETLTTSATGIADADGLANASFAWQWIANDGTADTDIAAATAETYTLTSTEAGKTIKVRVTFTDDGGTEETLVSTATAAVAASNAVPTGLPTIAGTTRAGETQTASAAGIADADGLANATYAWQWTANEGTGDADIAGATEATYTLTSAEVGKTVKVRVTFTDDRGTEETVLSNATAAVEAAVPPAIVAGGLQVTSTPQAASDTYGPGETIELTVTFDKAVTVDTTGGIPRIQFRLGPPRTDRWAEYSGGSGSTALTFTYEVQSGDMDSNGIWLPKNELHLRSGTIRDAATDTVDAALGYGRAGLQSGHKVDGSSADTPAIVAGGVQVTSTPQAASDTYGPGETIELTVTFDKAVTVDTTGGMPRIQFRLGPPRTDRWAEYSGGSGNTALRFTYEVQSGDMDSNGIWLPKNELHLRSGTIRDAATNTADAALSYARAGLQSGHKVDSSLIDTSEVSISAANDTTNTLTRSVTAQSNSVTEGTAAVFTLTRTGSLADALTVNVGVTETGAMLNGAPPATVTFDADSATAELRVETDDDEVAESASVITAELAAGSGYSMDAGASSATVTVEDDDAAPVVTTASPVEAAENGTAIATLAATDDDTPAADLAWSIVGGSDSAKFTLSADGDLSFAAAKDFEAPDDADRNGNYELTVRVTDGANPVDATLTVRLADVDEVAPALASASVDGNELALTFGEALDEGSTPGSDAFAVAVGGTARGVSHVAVNGSAVTLTLASAVVAGETVTVGYMAPTGANARLLRDVAGNSVAGFSDETVTNEGPFVMPEDVYPEHTGTISVSVQCVDMAANIWGPQLDDTGLWWEMHFSAPGVRPDTDHGTSSFEITSQDGTGFGYYFASGGPADLHNRVHRWSTTPTSAFSDVNGVVITVPAGGWQNGAGNSNSASTNSLYLAHNWKVSVADASATEGTDGTIDFEVTLNARDDCETVTVDWTTADGTATAGEDYAAASGTLTFGPGETSKTIRVALLETADEGGSETFSVQLGNASGITLDDSEAIGRISGVRAGNLPATGKPTVTGTARVGERLAASSTDIADVDGLTSATFTWQWIANDGTADADIAGATEAIYKLTSAEAGKTIKVRVSFTDDGGTKQTLVSDPTVAVAVAPNPVVSISAGNDATTEGTAAVFTLTRTGSRTVSLTDALTVNVSVTETGAMLSGTVAETVTFNVNSSTAELRVETADDKVVEPASAFTAALAAGSGYSVDTGAASATVTVEDDDAVVVQTAAIVTVPENTTAVTTLTATKDGTPIAYPHIVWWIGGGADAAMFTMSAGGDLAFASAKDFEAPDDADGDGDYEVTVRVTDHRANTDDAALTVRLTDVDDVPPVLIDANVNGDWLTLTFSEPLAMPLGGGDFSVAVDGAARGVSVVIRSGGNMSKVKLGLASAVVSGETVTVGYTVPNTQPLQDVAGNPVAGFSDEAVTNDTPASNAAPAGLPTISGTARVGETLTASASGILDADGLTNAIYVWQWIANDGTSDTDIAGATAETYTLTAAEAGKTVKVRTTFTDDGGTEETLVSDPTAAVAAGQTREVSISAANDTMNTLTRSVAAQSNSVTEGTAAVFTLTRTGSLADALMVNVGVTETGGMLNGAPPATVTFDADSATAELRVETEDDEVAESASVITAELAAGSGYSMNTGASSATVTAEDDDAAPVVTTASRVEAAENGTAIATLAATDDDTPAADLAWSIVGGSDWAKFTLSAGGDLAFAAAKDFEAPDDADQNGAYEITVRVTDGANPVDATLTVRLADVDEVAPALASANVDGDALVLTFDEALDGNSVPTASAFSVAVDGAARGVSDVSMSGSSVTLTLASAVVSGETVTVGYTVPTGANAHPLRDVAGSPVAGFSDEAVTNDTPASNAAPTGLPMISGTAQVGETLTASASGIADTDGLTNATFAWQWIANDGTADADIAGATGAEYTLTSAEEGKTIKVRVTFTDDGGTEETLVSEATAAVTVALPSVSVEAVSSPVTEGTAVSFTLRRTGDTAAALTVAVSVTVEGAVVSATPASSVTFAAGSAEAALSVATVDDSVAEADARVSVAVTAGSGYLVGSGAGSAGVDVYDNDEVASAPVKTLWTSTLEWQGDYGAGWVNANEEDFSSPDWSEDGEACRIWYIAYGSASRQLWLRVNSDSCADGISQPETLTLQLGGVTVGSGDGLSNFAQRNIGIVTGVEADWTPGEQVQLRLTRTEAGQTVSSGPGISVEDAQVREAEGAVLSFSVGLDAAQNSPVSVRYVTSDGTATAGADYEAVSGAVRFAPGETRKTVSVPVLNDAHDEGSETLTLTLSRPFGAELADGTATGTIVNTDPIPQAWITRFGRTVGSQVVDALTARFEDDGRSHVTVGGMSVSRSGPYPVERSDWNEWNTEMDAWGGAHEMTERELLLGSSFHLTSRERPEGGPAFAAWGRVARDGFEADVDDVEVDGDVTTGLIGFDAEWDRVLAGLLLSQSRGEGSYTLHGDLGNDRGTVESTLTGVYPYARLKMSERVSMWGLVGVGSGELTLHQEGRTRIDTDLAMRMGAFGVKSTVLDGSGPSRVGLNVKSDAMWVRTESDSAEGLESAEGDVTRLRLIVEGERVFEAGNGVTFTPSGEVGLRHDGGDAETGTGVELGAGIRYTTGALTIDGQVRALVAHEASGYEEWGASGAIRVNPGASGRGLSFTLAPAWGNATSGTGRLWSARDATSLAVGEDVEAEGRLEATVGYGMPVLGGRFTGTPEFGLGFSESGRDWRLGWRLGLAGSERGAFGLGVDATRHEPADDGAPETRLGMTATMRW